jgi:biopolymer transport protein ExbD
MSASTDEKQEEPNVVPLIDVSLVILVMALVISSVVGRLLPLELPKAARTQLVAAQETAGLVVSRDGTARLGGGTGMAPAELSAALTGVKEGTILLVAAEPGTRYESMVAVIDAVRARAGLKLAFAPGPPAAPGRRLETAATEGK